MISGLFSILIIGSIAFVSGYITLIFIYNKPNIEVKVTKDVEFDTYTVYLNYIKYIDCIEYEEKEDRSIKLFKYKKKHKE